MTPRPGPSAGPASLMRGPRFFALLGVVSVVGVVCSVAAWGLLLLLHEMQPWIYDDLPSALGFDSAPTWWPVPVLVVAGVAAALAITRLPGTGGHVPAHGLDPSPTLPVAVPGVIAAAIASIGFGMVLGPEAPLIAVGGALGLLAAGRLRGQASPEVSTVIGASGTFAAVSFLFGSPLIAAVTLIEATGVGGARLRAVLIPGLLAAGIGSLVSTGLGSWTGVDTAAISIDPVPVAEFARPDIVDFAWTIPFAGVIAAVIVLVFAVGRRTAPIAARRPLLVLPLVGLLVAGLAIVFDEATGKGAQHVLFSGQEELGPLVEHAGGWSLGALAVLIACKGLAYAFALGSFRGGPIFPAILLGAAAGLIAAELPGYELTVGVAVGIAAATTAALRLPLSALVLATVLTSQAGFGVTPLVILGAVVAYLTAEALSPAPIPGAAEPEPKQPAGSPGGV